jgi:hypothetical protein
VSGSHYDIAWTSPAGLQLARDGAQPITISAGQLPALLALPDKTILAFENQGAVEFRALRR